ncbi:MAG TPA: hypothetical protein VK961_01645 [Chthoniobacter sp.]|nr:hypothetical protein [Chthoniobacter sp.]
MTLLEAFAISKANQLHIRRASWPADKWIMNWRGIGQTVPVTGKPYFVRGDEYNRADLVATDWTTVPLPLAACPVTPGEPIGGDPPVPGSPGWPGFPDPGFPSAPSVPPDGGGSIPPLPTPTPGTGLTAIFSGIEPLFLSSFVFGTTHWEGVRTNGSHALQSAGGGTWTGTFSNGQFFLNDGSPDAGHAANFKITASIAEVVDGKPKFHLQLAVDLWGLGFSIIYEEATPGIRGFAMPNVEPTSSDWTGGSGTTGTVK